MQNLPKRAYLLLKNQGLTSLAKKAIEYPPKHPKIEGTLFRINTRINTKINGIKYKTIQNPFKTITADPKKGKYIANQVKKRKGLNQVKPGDWDEPKNCTPLKANPNIKGLIQRYSKEKEWEETSIWKHKKEKIENKGYAGPYTSMEEFKEKRLTYLDKIYQDMKNNGYKPNKKLGHTAPTSKSIRNNRKYLHGLEPLVCIGREGEFLWIEGLHRKTMAKILNIDKIPVQVMVRHKEWQKTKEKAVDRNNEKIKSDHPDLQNVTITG